LLKKDLKAYYERHQKELYSKIWKLEKYNERLFKFIEGTSGPMHLRPFECMECGGPTKARRFIMQLNKEFLDDEED